MILIYILPYSLEKKKKTGAVNTFHSCQIKNQVKLNKHFQITKKNLLKNLQMLLSLQTTITRYDIRSTIEKKKIKTKNVVKG